MFDLPYKRWLDFIHLGVIGGGAAIAHQFPGSPFDLIGGLIAASGFVMIAGNEWGCMVNKSKELAPNQSLLSEAELREIGQANYDAKHKPVETPKPKINIYGNDKVFALNLQPVKVDYEREFCKTLVDMKRGGFDMNISEKYWLKEGRWKGVPSEFIGMRNKFEYYHIFGKKGSATNSPFVVLNEQAVEMRAEGKLRLPTPPGL